MTNVISFPINKKRHSFSPWQRVFYIGYRYVGPMFCQDVQQLYLKRHGLNHSVRKWSLITYAPYDESSSRSYSIELECCDEDSVLEMLEKHDVRNDVTIADLFAMGWRGSLDPKIGGEVRSIFHSCYDGLVFPPFARPYGWHKPKFYKSFGTKVMAQSRTAKATLINCPVHSYTIFNSGKENWVWMNLKNAVTARHQTVPILPLGNLPKDKEISRSKPDQS